MKKYIFSILFICFYIIIEISAQNIEPTDSLPLDSNSTNKSSLIINQTLNVIKNNTFTITLNGTGWIYLGENDPLIIFTRYKKRIFENENTVYSFTAIKEGVGILHFYKQDLINKTAHDEYISVTITANPPPESITNDKTKAKATENITATESENATSVENLHSSTQNTSMQNSSTSQNSIINSDLTNNTASSVASKETTTIDSSSEIKKVLTADELFNLATEAYNNEEYQKCINYLDDFFIIAIRNIDKAWYLRGLNYEAESDLKNIKEALESYKILITQYPDSELWDKAQKRIQYIKRYYYNIR